MKLLFAAIILSALAAVLFFVLPTAKSTLPNSDDSQMFELNGSNSNLATDFLKSLSSEQRKKAILPIEDESRERWHYLPLTMFDRSGIVLQELDDKQKKLAFELLRSHLSETGYAKVRQIIELEKVLAELTNNPRTRDPEKYVIAFYGDPSADKIWAWSFEGHHISLNFTISDDKISIVPRFLGANPATIQTGKRKGERTLAEEQDLAFELLNSLNTEQRAAAVFRDSTFYDIVSRSDSKVSPLDPVGIKYAELNDSQKAILQELIGVYLSAMPEKIAAERFEKLKREEQSEIHFAWAGAITKDQPHYYRIQGKTFLIEFDNTQNNANHIHTVWRDFEGDFGRDLIKEHYKKSNHHKKEDTEKRN